MNGAPGTWELIVSTGRDASTGSYRRVIRTVKGLTKREAKAALAELEVSVAQGRVGADDPTLAVLLERWMEHLTAIGRADTTLYNYRRNINKEIVPALGTIRLSKLTAQDIDRLYVKLRKRNLKPATIHQVHAVLRGSFEPGDPVGPRAPQRRDARVSSAARAERAPAAGTGDGACLAP